MAATRLSIHIYEDPATDGIQPQQSSTADYSPSALLLQSTTVPPTDTRSPLKLAQPRVALPKPVFHDVKQVFLPHPQGTTIRTDTLMKPSQMPKHLPVVTSNPDDAGFHDFPAFTNADQENHPPLNHPHHNDNYAQFPDPPQDYHLPEIKPGVPKRPSANARVPQSIELDASAQVDIPEPHELPQFADDHKKPRYSYSFLIGSAILRSEKRRLTLQGIYKWISENFSYYRLSDASAGWNNSIRHNLSIHEEFVKMNRPKDDPGKGHYWIINPGMEGRFLNGKSTRRPQSAGGPAMKTFSQPMNEPSSSVWSLPAKVATESVAQPVPTAEQPSSDATLPASDSPLAEYDLHETCDMPPPAPRVRMSSPYLGLGSSPPVADFEELNDELPAQALKILLPAAQTTDRKRKSTGMDDSGYFSSLDSSATRPYANPDGRHQTDEDRPRLKRGRAEEEIARIRSSSHDVSPSKGRALFQPAASQVPSSSPIQCYEMPTLQLELTPALKLDLPSKALASISPSTDLSNHRNKVDTLYLRSPRRNLGTPLGEAPFSPGFPHLIGDHFSDDGRDLSFTIFDDDANEVTFLGRLSASADDDTPSRLAGRSKMSHTLADITNSQKAVNAKASASKLRYLESPIRKTSAFKARKLGDIRNDAAAQDFFTEQFLNDENEEPGDFDEIDLSQGFQKIGRKATPKIKRVMRPVKGAMSHT
ncbi:MAG: hypothetical protein LQ350_001137 [Teloschistes chrysophthalmus]|nr:MAG: hypothetical protein LQ350_001137 [Niorma chrysophthalma]